MGIKCKASDSCPRKLDICCAECDSPCRHQCDGWRDYRDCSEAEITEDGIAAFRSAVPETIQKMTALLKQMKAMEEQQKSMRAELLKAMEAHGVKSFATDQLELVYVAPTSRTTVDSAKLKKEHPDIYAKCSKTSSVSASVRVTLK